MAVLNKYKDYIPPDAVYIGRGTKFGNPFPINDDSTRNNVINNYKVWIKKEIRAGNITLVDLASLHNKDMVCYCAPKSCHGDILEKLSAWAFDKLHPLK